MKVCQSAPAGFVGDAEDGHPVAVKGRQEHQQEHCQPDPHHGYQSFRSGKEGRLIQNQFSGHEQIGGFQNRGHQLGKGGCIGRHHEDKGTQVHTEDAEGEIEHTLKQHGPENGTEIAEALQQSSGTGFLAPDDAQDANVVAQTQTGGDYQLNDGQDSLGGGEDGAQAHIA